MIKSIIIDDELLAIRILQKYFQAVPELSLKKYFTNPLEAIEFLKENEIDLIFLDINMPQLDGLSFLNLLDKQPAIIFTTAYPEYAVESYEYQALDYLLKPFSQDRFLKAIEKVKSFNGTPSDQAEKQNYLVVRADRKSYRLPYEEIHFLKAFGDYVVIKTNNGQIVPKSTLSELEKLLPLKHFIRTHRTYIINKRAVKYLEGNRIAIGDEKIPISKSFKDKVLNELGFE